jgi:hypothetical protein
MKTRQHTIVYALFLLLCCFAVVTANGQQPTINQIRAASESDRISDWALSGIVWSDANLAEKLARRAADGDLSEQQSQELRRIARNARQTVEAMKRFGWSQLRRPRRSAEMTRRSAPAEQASERQGLVARKNRGVRNLPPSKRLDTETPVGRDDPGIDDEMRGKETDLDIDQYRVDDVVDETPRERANLADAIEDGVEKAIASAPSRGIDGENPARISYRETQTRSNTMPFKPDAIRDNDDFDPDADYLVDNPLGMLPDNPDSVNYTEEDDDIDPAMRDISPDGEDELLRSLRRDRAEQRDLAERRRKSDYRRFTKPDGPALADARWVQFHLDANQMTWDRFSERSPKLEEVRDAFQRMRVHARLAIENTSDPVLRGALRELLNRS